MSNVCRWGILSTASISRKNWKAIWNAENATLAAVASRDVNRAQYYIDELQLHTPFAEAPKALGSYDELLANPNIDSVYLPLPTGLRKEWVIKAAQAGKHVLCEKPCGATVADLKEILEACSEHHVQFMDGVMFMHSDRLQAMRRALDDPENVGDIKRIITNFSFNGGDEFVKDNIRTSGNLEPLGCLGDLGWYNIRFSLWAMNWQMPTKVSGRMLSQHEREGAAVPIEFSGELFFDGGISASFYCSFITELHQLAVVAGTKGHLELDDFVLPFFGNRANFFIRKNRFQQVGCDFNMEDHCTEIHLPEYSNSNPSAQETKMIQAFSTCVHSGTVDKFWPEIALKTQQVLAACLESSKTDGTLVSL